ncbi:MAG: glutathione S-transferase N-terminal domain-containing protein [Pseudomonadota bacterium]|nr:glutathione S-transferase N-terminal domain-containing protein [Pseudomonadota bacterium]
MPPSAMLPLLYTFRRCPYAMRARWALHVARVAVRQHEVSLRDKPAAMLAASPKGTVPVLVLPDGQVLDESLDIMRWALAQHDPEGWFTPERGTLADMLALVAACEQDFKPHLDRSKYATRYRSEWAENSAAGEAAFAQAHWAKALAFLQRLAALLQGVQADHSEGDSKGGNKDGSGPPPYLMGQRPALADFAIVPFVRQLARHDPARWAQHAPPAVARWMAELLARADFEAVMRRAAPGA